MKSIFLFFVMSLCISSFVSAQQCNTCPAKQQVLIPNIPLGKTTAYILRPPSGIQPNMPCYFLVRGSDGNFYKRDDGYVAKKFSTLSNEGDWLTGVNPTTGEYYSPRGIAVTVQLIPVQNPDGSVQMVYDILF